MSRKIIIDTDPGIDDAMAILFALQSPELDVLALTSVFGNVDIGQTTRNARQILDLAGRSDVVVSAGASQPLLHPFDGGAPFVHGENGLGNVQLPPPRAQLSGLPAAYFLVQQLLSSSDTLTIIALGPLTNLALAVRLEPRIVDKVERVILMGGAALVVGNVSPVAEANIHNDPEAAKIVFGAGWPLTMLGLNLTTQVVLDAAHVKALDDAKKPLTDFITSILPCYLDFYRTQCGRDDMDVHDLSAMVYAVAPDLFTAEEWYVEVETMGRCAGQTVVDYLRSWGQDPNVEVCVSVDAASLLDLFYQRMTA